jgi:hypothetical protein
MSRIPNIPGVNNPKARVHYEDLKPGQGPGAAVAPGAKIDDFDGDGNTSNDDDDLKLAQLTAMKEFMEKNPSSNHDERMKALVKEFGGGAALSYQTHLLKNEIKEGRLDPNGSTQPLDDVTEEVGRVEDEILAEGGTIFSAIDGQEHTSANTPSSAPADPATNTTTAPA